MAEFGKAYRFYEKLIKKNQRPESLQNKSNLAIYQFKSHLQSFKCTEMVEYLEISFGVECWPRPDSLQNFMDTVKTTDLNHLCIQIKNTEFFSNHTHIKFTKKSTIKNMSTVKQKYWVTPCFVSQVLHDNTDIHGRPKWLGQYN